MGPWQGLIIDDFFALAVQPGSFRSGTPSPSSALVDHAKAGYEREAVLGSDDKDVRDQRHFKVAGAEVDASERTVAEGMTLCGYPVLKRLALAAASVRAAQCPALSEELVSTLCGSWVSCLLYRRCLMSALDRLFSLGRAEAASSTPGSDLRHLSRATASELQLLAVLAPVAVSNLSASPSPQVFASDASMEKGVFCSTEVAPEVALQLWLASDFKGAAVTLEGSTPPPPQHEDVLPEPPLLAKPLAFRFDVLVVGEPSPIREEAPARGLSVGLCSQRSSHYCLASRRFCEWLVHLACSGHVRAIVLRPPGDTFARACRPPLRSVHQPLGFRRALWPVQIANRIASACFTVLLATARHGVAACLLHPASSLLCFHPAWIFFRERAVCREELFEARRLSTLEAPNLRALTCGLPPLRPRAGPHLPGQKQLSCKPLWSLRPFARWLAKCIATAAREGRPPEPPRTSGFESLLANDLLQPGQWRVVSEWRWRRRIHINVLETLAAVKVVRKAALMGGDCKVVLLLDSAVGRGAIAKGRSSSRLLRPALLKMSAALVAGGIYLGMSHAPTRFNVADDPSRSVPLRSAAGLCLCTVLCGADLVSASGFVGHSASTAGWLRLSLLSLRVSRIRFQGLLGSLGLPRRAACKSRRAGPTQSLRPDTWLPGRGADRAKA